MAKGSSPQLALFCLFAAHFCWGGDIKRFARTLAFGNWEEGRQSCQDMVVDLASVDTLDAGYMNYYLRIYNHSDRVWVGLHRDPESDKAWRWIDTRTGEQFTGSDFSNDSSWSPGEQDPHCAAVGADRAWHSLLCSTPHPVYCSSRDNITFMGDSQGSWDAAEKLCQRRSMSVATVNSANSRQFNRAGWIGLRREGGDTWKWSDGSPVGYTNWAAGEPRTRDCGSLNGTSQQWHSDECSRELQPLCLYDYLLVVKLNKSWEEAVTHCRELEMHCTEDSCVPSYDLATPECRGDTHYIGDRMYREGTADEVWVGLRFLAGGWTGLHGEPISNWVTLPECPSQQRCGTVAKYNDNKPMLRDCSERKNFICARSPKSQYLHVGRN